MKDSDCREVPTTEVELSAADLLELSSNPTIEQSTRSSELQPLELREGVMAATTRPAQPRRAAPPPTTNRRVSARTIVSAFSVAVVAITAIGVQQHSMPDGSAQSSLTPASQGAASLAQAESTTATEGPPTQFTNPFDPSEVFAFPSGTSEAEARAAVADLLLKRATERHDQLHAQR